MMDNQYLRDILDDNSAVLRYNQPRRNMMGYRLSLDIHYMGRKG